MKAAACNICSIIFDEKEYVPKVLECGNTICLRCLKNIFKGRKKCPICKRALSKSLEEYPTNFIILEIFTSSKRKCSDLQEIRSLVENVSFLEKVGDSENFDEQTSSLDVDLVTMIERNLSILQGKVVKNIRSLREKLNLSDEDNGEDLRISDGDDEVDLKLSDKDDEKESFYGDDEEDLYLSSDGDDGEDLKLSSEGDDGEYLKLSDGDDGEDLKLSSDGDDGEDLKLSSDRDDGEEL